VKQYRVRAQRGMTLVVVCLLLIAFLGIAALCIDLGVLYTARTSAQHAADAAALAGAFTFVNSPTATQPNAAQQAAIATAGANKILGQTVTIASGDVVVDTATRRVTVTVSRLGTSGINTFFAKAIGMSQASVQVQAMAQASASAGASRCVKPVYIPNTIYSTLDPAAACTASPPQVIFDSSNNISAWAQNQSGGFRFTGQCNFIRPTSPSGALLPSQFYSLDFGSGAATYRDVWANCLNLVSGATPGVVKCGDSIPVETGNMVGPTRQGVGDMIGNPQDTWLGPDPTTGVLQYQTSTGISNTSKSLAVVAVWDNCHPPAITSGTNGQSAPIIGFLDVFVDGMSNDCSGPANGGNNVRVHTVNAITCNGPGSGSTTPGPFAVPVQLVKH
jgi:Putative Flp pilus-assembly TadE/G-like